MKVKLEEVFSSHSLSGLVYKSEDGKCAAFDWGGIYVYIYMSITELGEMKI